VQQGTETDQAVIGIGCDTGNWHGGITSILARMKNEGINKII
jgi:hypothetical protein